jgi:deoxyribodipyrimidine photo-lyase
MKGLCWIRRDLRTQDHASLYHALKENSEVVVVFIFDSEILKNLDSQDPRLSFIMDSLSDIDLELKKYGSSLVVKFGNPVDLIPQLALDFKVQSVYTNRDYEPYAKKRDAAVEKILKKEKINFHTYKDHVIFEKHEILTKSRTLFKVFTPYKNEWLFQFEKAETITTNFKPNFKNLKKINFQFQNILKENGFSPKPSHLHGGEIAAKKLLKSFHKKIDHYHETRDFPSQNGTSQLSPYIRFGNLSIREIIRMAKEKKTPGSSMFLSELIWRDFYQMILDAHPDVEKSSFKKQYDQIKWLGDDKNFKKWCAGLTGFPIVDAAMRCLNQTGLMPNRLRMVVASFLCKTLLIDWRKGEKYFAQKLLDFDLAANNGGWQWCSSSGCDAQPYFRIFNPTTQSEKFDPEGKFIKEWCPEYAQLNAKEIHLAKDPIVDYKAMRELCLMQYAVVKEKS